MAFYEAVALADATQGGISYNEALGMTEAERKAAIAVMQDIRKEQEENRKKKRSRDN